MSSSNRRPSRRRSTERLRNSHRQSNNLSGSVRIEQLRTLQHQLSNMIQDAKENSLDDDKEFTIHSSDKSTPSASLRTISSPNERPTMLSNNDYVHDIELGRPTVGTSYKYKYKPRRKSPQSMSPLLTKYVEKDEPTTMCPATASNNFRSNAMRKYPSRKTISEISDDAMSSISTDPTVSMSGSLQSSCGIGVPSTKSSGAMSRRSRFAGGAFSRQNITSASTSPSRSISRSLSRSVGSPCSARRSTRKLNFRRKRSSNHGMNTISNSSKREIKKCRPTRQLSEAPNYDFLGAEKDVLEEGILRPGAKWWHGVFIFSSIGMLACIITLWAPYPIGARVPSTIVATMPWSDGCQGLKSCICPRETVCADDFLSMVFLTIARSSAWFDYPLYILLFMSKANNLNNFLQHTALRCWINFSDYHHVHSLFGIIVGFESTTHAFFHTLRWARRRDDIQLLWTSQTGRTGLIAIILCPFIILPMTVPYLKKQMSFEWRKGLHYLSIIWGAALMCHAPARIFWLIGIPFFIYAADKMMEGFLKTHLVESAHFQRLGDTSCIISFENPPGFGKQNSAYVYLMLPWLSKYQFHAFTVFPDTKANHSSICIHKCGDWTQKLMKTITTPMHKPAFVVGPFLSPFSSPAMDSEHLVAVASGIGVTPAISLIKQYSSTSRRLNLIWICRDAGLVEHFLQNVDFGSDGYTLIYYTGRDRELILQDDLPPNVLIFNGRPSLERTICGIITGIATGEGLPEELHNKVLTQTPANMRSKLLLEKALSIYTMDQLYAYTVKASAYHSEGMEPKVDTVNYQGVLSTMRHLLGDDYELVAENIINNFDNVNTSGDCQMDFNDFEFFFNLMLEGSNTQELSSMANVKLGLQRMNTCRDMFEISLDDINKLSESDRGGSVFGIRQHLNGDGKFSARNWNMLYCGGSQPVLDQLKAFKRKFGIALSVEKFDW